MEEYKLCNKGHMLCILTRKKVLCTLFTGQNQFLMLKQFFMSISTIKCKQMQKNNNTFSPGVDQLLGLKDLNADKPPFYCMFLCSFPFIFFVSDRK